MPDDRPGAIVQPVLKRTGLDPPDLFNSRPISKLPFLSKVMKKVFFYSNTIQSFLENYSIFEVFQSGFRAKLRTESVLLRVQNDILLNTYSRTLLILMLLDMSSAFNTVDHNILVSWLGNHVGFCGIALKGIPRY